METPCPCWLVSRAEGNRGWGAWKTVRRLTVVLLAMPLLLVTSVTSCMCHVVPHVRTCTCTCVRRGHVIAGVQDQGLQRGQGQGEGSPC